MELRLQTFEDVQKDTPLLQLPVVFTGTRREECERYAADQGYTFKSSPKMLFGGYFYKNTGSATFALLPT